jgi:hypothetical protein
MDAARRLTAEAGPDAGGLLDPALAAEIAAGMAQDIAAAITARAAAADTIDALVDALLDAVVDAAEPWRDGLGLAHVALERECDFDRWSELLGPWLTAVEETIAAAQARGVVRADAEPRATALVLRDTLDRAARVQLRFERTGYREAAAALVRAALRA